MRTIPLTQGQVALVDDDDYPILVLYSWHATRGKVGGWYAATNDYTTGKRKTVKMHRFILDAPHGVLVDHEDRNSLNNQKNNLRFATFLLNVANTMRAGRYGLKGVTLRKNRTIYSATISYQGTSYHLGSYQESEMAALAYDCAARHLFGSFACLNFPEITDYPFTVESLFAPHTASTHRGVTRNERSGNWISFGNNADGRVHLGTFPSYDEALAVRLRAEEDGIITITRTRRRSGEIPAPSLPSPYHFVPLAERLLLWQPRHGVAAAEQSWTHTE